MSAALRVGSRRDGPPGLGSGVRRVTAGVLEPDLWEAWIDPENDDQRELKVMLLASAGVLVHPGGAST
jgi:hypothetical protein